MITGKTYKDRVISQNLLWLNGKPEHNHTDGECCPDFSCCEPDLFTESEQERANITAGTIEKLRGF